MRWRTEEMMQRIKKVQDELEAAELFEASRLIECLCTTADCFEVLVGTLTPSDETSD